MTSRQRWTLLTVCLGTFMLLLDITIVNVALPEIQRDLHASFSDLQWVVDAYALTLAALLLTGGSTADLYGRRRVFAIGIVLFTIASVMCGLASSPLALNLSRAGQGIGGALMFATSLALLAQEFHGRDRGTAFGLWGATVGAAVAIGPLVGGVLTEHLGWEWIFFVNVPVGAIALTLTLTRLAESREPTGAGVDWIGVVTFSGALFCLVLALVEANDRGWGSAYILSLFAAAALLMTVFVAAERRVASPMLDLTLLRKPAFAGGAAAAFLLSFSMFAMFLFITLYLQGVLGYSALETGWEFLPLTVVSFFVAPVSGRLAGRVPIRVLLSGGLLLVSIGLLLMHGVGTDSSWTTLLPGFIVAGAGIGMANPQIATTAVGVVPPERSGMGSGINTTFRQVGIATGVAALGAVMQSRVGTPAIQQADPREFVDALNALFVIGSCTALLGAVLAFALVRQEDFVAARPAAEAASAA
jgi:EmrB/QacA subfamily drug resistance transporter